MIAVAIQESLARGYGGEIALIAATKAFGFFQRCGMIQIGTSQRFFMDEIRARQFLKEWKWIA
ncbi:hypothetical protein [Candidatus Hakubella thermalkaliphila]|uniref:hypothetical protein n=1 Tax=Candidatus Hakubella thermalkaliphila TaxID=2754717 RepID=UPI001593A7FC|nr:hypothetical protein [Candidatus Hakubella thermalkaliphila]